LWQERKDRVAGYINEDYRNEDCYLLTSPFCELRVTVGPAGIRKINLGPLGEGAARGLRFGKEWVRWLQIVRIDRKRTDRNRHRFLPSVEKPLTVPQARGWFLPSFLQVFLRDWENYFLGLSGDFSPVFDLSACTPFQREVLTAVRSIPAGNTWSYKKLAAFLGFPRAYRAVGQALRSNPVPLIIPCHRVVGSAGRLGGYSAGLKWKRFLLDWEQNHFFTEFT